MKKVVAGMDLHSNNVVIGIMDLDGKRPQDIKKVFPFPLQPDKPLCL